MKLGGTTAGCLPRGTVIEPVWLAPFKSVKHMGYENITRDMEISTWQLHKESLNLKPKEGKSLNFKLTALQNSGDSVVII